MTRGMRTLALVVGVLAGLAIAAASTTQPSPAAGGAQTLAAGDAAAAGDEAVAIFAGGCFWCMEGPFDALPGVISTTSGYTGGTKINPTYEQVSAGGTGHAESVQVRYQPSKLSYEQLLDVFWHNIDPVAVNQQFCDHGTQYRSAIFYTSDEQRRLAQASKAALEASGKFSAPIATAIEPAGPFYPAEAYHQDYYLKNPLRYHYYRARCGRDQRLEAVCGVAPSHTPGA
jgi:peptide-methionine (S)-S-oxide reductase